MSRDLVKKTYARGGRPSIDPVVFFKLQLVMFFEDIVRCEIAYFEWVVEKLPQARVQACHQFLRAFLVTGGCLRQE